MKKIVGTIAAIALAASSAFAGANFGMGFNRGAIAPFVMEIDNGSTTMGMTNSAQWGWNGPRIAASFSGGNDVCGVVADVKFDGGEVKVNDNAYIWVKPFDWMKLQLGQSFDNTLCSGVSYGSWNMFRAMKSVRGDDATFKRIGDISADMGKDESTPLTGAILMLDPIEGLHIAAGFPIAYAPGVSTYENIFKNIQVAAGYTIADVMQIKAQYIGKKDYINAAVSLKAVEGMTLDVGAYFGTKSDMDIVVAAIWGMGFGGLGLNVNAEAVIPTVTDGKMTLTAGAGIDYDLGNGIGLGADYRFSQKFADGEKASMEIGAWVSKGFANGSVQAGVQAFINDGPNGVSAAAHDLTLAVPVVITVGF
ncbi:MAG: hypothetical protein MJ184_10355 [Treponema sp.]|uniref:hypothetical protein n=1 Tax=Treponema sp. TaxID=166 RepID=UPI00298E0D44|nr:hypothetical protein [Treponema sp.]MCQ2601747.1 hypothetical protein [Treponema sp.]